jgi:outer membrane cobalamin receptor
MSRHHRDGVRVGGGSVTGQNATTAPNAPTIILNPVVVARRAALGERSVPEPHRHRGSRSIQNNQLQVNLSESLAGIPGVSIQNRWNYAQDLQLSIRGFGARANFGVRGIRLYQDYIPATMPDGQGQTGSFSLVSAQRIEVMRGPFSSLYGNAAGGVISVFTEDGPAIPMAGGNSSAGAMQRGTRLRRRRVSRAPSTMCSPETISRSMVIAITARRHASSATRASRSPPRPTRRLSSLPTRCINPKHRIRSA